MKRWAAGIVATAVAAFAFMQPATAQQMDHGSHDAHAAMSEAVKRPAEAGQSAFAAVAEIVALLEADPHTDWSMVNIAALREHLVDMDNLFLRAEAEQTVKGNTVTITITGKDETLRAIQAMVPAHAAELAKIPGWSVTAQTTDDGAVLKVSSQDEADVARIAGLGFFGLMATGAHHQPHHLAIATGQPMH